MSTLIALVLASAMLVSAASAVPSQGSPRFKPLKAQSVVEGVKSSVGRIARSDPSLLNRSDSTQENVIVKLDYDSTATYDGGIRGLEATSPTKTGKDLKDNSAAVDEYENFVEGVENKIVAAIENAVSNETIMAAFKTVYGGIAMQLPANQIDELLKVEGVVAVQKNDLEQPLTDNSPTFIGATEAWGSLGGAIKAGEGVIVGVLDTGIWPEHPSYMDRGIERPPGTWRCEFGLSGDPNDPAFLCNDKLIGAYAFTANYQRLIGALPGEYCQPGPPPPIGTARCSARDADGHGTHTSSTAAGSPVDNANPFGIDRGPISGIAPGAHVIMYRVCLAQGCFQADSVSAVQQAVRDGVDVLNFSISGGNNPYTDAVELAFLDAYAAGILVNASAGNAGPGAGTANHGGPWTNTVAASYQDRQFLTELQMVSSDGASFTATGATITPGIDELTPVVRASEIGGDIFCATPLPPGSAVGRVVVCSRGAGIGRVRKGYNVFLGGAEGMILYNPTRQDLFTDNHWLPTIMIEGPSPANELVAFLDAHPDRSAMWATGVATKTQGDIMTTFSSKGPLGDFLKPDVTAPGIQILAGHTPRPHPTNVDVGPPGQFFQAIAGTSMSSPHSAGASAIVKAAHRDWRPGQIKSALMTSSLQDVLKEDAATPSDPHDRGAGSIRVNRAINPTVTFNVPASSYYASAGDPLNRVHLNLPSIQLRPFGGELTTTRLLQNVSGRRQVLIAETQGDDGLSIEVTPRRLELDAGESRSVRITIEGPTLANNNWYYGQITFDPRREGAVEAVVPVAVFKAQGVLTLEHLCEPTTFPRGENADCQVTVRNTAGQQAAANLEVEGPGNRGVEIQNVSPPGQPTSPNGFRWTGTLSPAMPPQIVSLTPGGQEYIQLTGIPPVAGVGDDTGHTFNVPAYQFGGETYNQVCMVSNGYAVVGACGAGDVAFVPQTFPNPARPNNVLAAFWTDLNPPAGGTLHAATGTVGEVPYIILEWRNVAVFDAPAERQTFEIWIRSGATEGINFAYQTIVGNGSSDGLNTGAENRDGTSGRNLGRVPVSGEEITVNTSPPAAGGSQTITYDAFGRRVGDWDIVARLTSNITVGTTTEVVHLTVTPR